MTAPALRPLSLGEVLDVSFGLYRSLFLPLLLVTLITQTFPLVVSVYIQAAGGPMEHLVLWIVTAFASLVLSAIATAACTVLISENYLGRSSTAGAALTRAVPFVGRLTSLTLLFSFIIAIGTVLLIVPGVILFVGLILATPAMVLEGIGAATDALGRSWSLTRGFRGKIFGALIAVFVLILLPSVALGTFLAVSNPTTPEAVLATSSPTSLAIQALISLLQVLITPLFYCLVTVMYYDLRVRKEAFDLEVLASSLQPA